MNLNASTTRTYVSYTQTVSKDFQSRRHEFGMNVEVTQTPEGFAKVKRAQQFAEAVVKNALSQKIGLRRRELDALAAEFFGVTWQEAISGVSRQEELL